MNRETRFARLMHLGLLLFLTSITGLAQGQTQSEDPLRGLRGAAVVSVNYVDLHHPVGAKVALLEPQLEPGAQAMADQRTPGVAAQLLAEQLEAKGYQIASDSDQPVMRVGWYLAMDSDISDDELLRRFGVAPGYSGQPQSERFEKGTMVVQAMDPSGHKVLWRGVMQGLADHEVDPQHQSLRMQYILERIMARFPGAGESESDD